MKTGKKPKKAHITRYGEGSFKWHEDRQLWRGRWDTGDVNSNGRRIILTASARDEDTAWQRFTAVKKKYLLEGPQLQGLKNNQTIKGWANEWQKQREGKVRAKTLASDASNLNQWIIPQIGNVKLEALTAAHMRKVGDAARAAGRSLSTANSAQRTLNKMLVAALADGYRVPERIFAAKKSTVGKSDRTTMSKQEVAATFTQAYAMYPDAVRLFLAVLYGSRASEILGLTWDRVIIEPTPKPDAVIVGKIILSKQVQALPYLDRAAGTFRIKDGDQVEHLVDRWHLVPTKTDAGERELPLIVPVAKELEAWKKKCPTGDLNPHNLVFPRIHGQTQYLGYPRDQRSDAAEWQTVQKAADVYKRHPTSPDDKGEFYLLHEARHSMISMLADAAVPKHIIELLVGQTELVDTYVHGSMELAATAVQDVLAPLLPASKQ